MASSGGNAGLYGGIGPVAAVNQQFAPIQAQQAQAQQARVQGLNNLVGSILAALNQHHPDAYGAAAHDAVAAANGAAQTLNRVNPNASTQAMLQAIGAPAAQQEQVGAQNNNTFAGGGALLQYTQGALPAGVFAQDQAARNTYLRSLPATVGLSALQGLGQFANTASKENADLTTQKLAAYQQARANLSDYMTKNQSNRISQAAVVGNLLGYIPAGTLGNKKAITTTSGQRVNIAQQNADTAAQKVTDSYNLAVKKLNKVNQPKANASLSKAKGYIVDDYGAPILQNGQRVTIPKATSAKTKQPLGLSPRDYQKYTSQALGAARNYHGVWIDSSNQEQQPLSWQQYLTHGENAGIPVSILIKQGKKVYSPAERSQGLIPGKKK